MENIQDFKNYLICKNLSERTIYIYVFWIKIFLNFLENKELNKINVALFIKEISKDHKPRSVRCGFIIIKQYIKFKKFDFLNELSDIKLPNYVEEPRIVLKRSDYENLQLLLNSDAWINKRDSLILEIMFKTGLRSDEILNLGKMNIIVI